MDSRGRSRFVSLLRTAQTDGRAVAVYADAEDFQSYEVGFVEHIDESELVLLCLTPKGEPDGRRAIRCEDLVRVDMDNSYTRKLELLYQYRTNIFDNDFRPGPKSNSDLKAQLENARENNTLVHLVDGNDYGPTGFVKHVGDDYVEIERIGTNGEPDGMATVMCSSLTKLHFGRRQEQVLEFLYRYNYELKKLLGGRD